MGPSRSLDGEEGLPRSPRLESQGTWGLTLLETAVSLNGRVRTMMALGLIWDKSGGDEAGPQDGEQGVCRVGRRLHQHDTQPHPVCKWNGEKQPLPERSTQEAKV